MWHFVSSTTEGKRKKRENAGKKRWNWQWLGTSLQTTAHRCMSTLTGQYFCPSIRPPLRAMQLTDESQLVFVEIRKNMKKVHHLPTTCQHVKACSNKNHRVVKIGRAPRNVPGLTKTQGYLLTQMLSVMFLPSDISGNPRESSPVQEL